ncbi:MAG: MFS transporter [Bacillota bacterium]
MQPKSDFSLKKTALAIVTMGSFLTPFMSSSINLALPSIAKEFASGTFLLSWVATSYILASAAFLVPFGRLADIIGRKKIFTLGVFIFLISSILCGLAWSIETLIFFRMIQGLGGAMIFGTSMAILTSIFPPQERGRVLGLNVAAVYIGLSLGPVLGGAINHNLGWHYLFFLPALICLPLAYFLLFKLPGEWKGAEGEKYDLTGAVLYAVGISAFIYGFSSVTASPWAKYILVLGLVFLAVFIRYAMKLEQPVLNLRLFSGNKTFAFSTLAALINYSATFALGFILSIYLQIIMGFTSQGAGLILLSQPVMMALLSPFAGKLSDIAEPRLVASLGMGLCTLGLLVFAFININTPLWLIVLNLIVLGMGFALFSSPNSNAAMGAVEKRFYGVASATLGTMRLIGQAISMAIVTLILAIYVGNMELSLAPGDLIIKGSKITFIVFAVLCLCGIFPSLARGNINTAGASERLQQMPDNRYNIPG